MNNYCILTLPLLLFRAFALWPDIDFLSVVCVSGCMFDRHN